MVKNGNPHDTWIDFLQQLQHFSAGRGVKVGKSCDLSSRTRVTSNEALLHWLRDVNEHNRNVVGLFPEGNRCGCIAGHQYVGV
jgi:hypothetical protein